jgi:DtxR family Mn-dependent transcriptional regulator
VKITEEKADLLRYLGTMGLVPGATLEVVGKAPFNGPITLRVGRTNHALSIEVASIIKVRRTT